MWRIQDSSGCSGLLFLSPNKILLGSCVWVLMAGLYIKLWWQPILCNAYNHAIPCDLWKVQKVLCFACIHSKCVQALCTLQGAKEIMVPLRVSPVKCSTKTCKQSWSIQNLFITATKSFDLVNLNRANVVKTPGLKP